MSSRIGTGMVADRPDETLEKPVLHVDPDQSSGRRIAVTGRLNIREMTDADLPFLKQMLANVNVMQFYPHPLSAEEAEAWLRRQQNRYANDGHGLWLVEDRQTGASLGQVGLVRQQVEGTRMIELGYMIDEPFWRTGIAREAGQACLAYGFKQLKLDSICSLIRPENISSQRTAEALGMLRGEIVTFHTAEHWRYRIDAQRFAR